MGSGPCQGQGRGVAVWGTVSSRRSGTAQVLAWLPLTDCAAQVLVYHCVPQFSHLQNGMTAVGPTSPNV